MNDPIFHLDNPNGLAQALTSVCLLGIEDERAGNAPKTGLMLCNRHTTERASAAHKHALENAYQAGRTAEKNRSRLRFDLNDPEELLKAMEAAFRLGIADQKAKAKPPTGKVLYSTFVHRGPRLHEQTLKSAYSAGHACARIGRN